MANCTQCGAEILREDRFCAECGAKARRSSGGRVERARKWGKWTGLIVWIVTLPFLPMGLSIQTALAITVGAAVAGAFWGLVTHRRS